MPQVDREGIFKAAAGAGVSLKQVASGAMAVTLNLRLTDYLNGNEWVPWSEYGQHVYADIWLIKTDGSVNQTAVETLKNVLGWDGNPDTLESLETPAVQVTVKAETRNNQTYYNGTWINPLDYLPGPKPLDTSILDQLKKAHGSKLRAAFGSPPAKTGKSVPKPTELPPVPPRPGCTKDEAWAAYCAAGTSLGLDDAAVADCWRRTVMAQGDEATFGPQLWASIRDDAEKELQIPF